MKMIIINKKLPSGKRKIENGNVIQSSRIPAFSTLTEKPGTINLRAHRGEARVVNNTIKKPLTFKRKSIKISKAPLPSLTNTERMQKEKKTPRICNPTNSPVSPSKNSSIVPTLVQNTQITNKKEINKTNNCKQNSSKIGASIKNYAKKNTTLKKTTNDRVTNIQKDKNNKKEKEEIKTKSSSTSIRDTDRQQWICCTVNNRDCKSLVEMPTNVAQCKGKLGASTMPRLFKNYHQEKLAKINEEIRYINSLSKSKTKLVQQEINNQPGLKEKVKKISEEIREMNAKKRPPPKGIKPIPDVRELLRKKVEQLNREIRLTNKKRTDAHRRSVFIRRLKKIQQVLDEYQKKKNSKKMSASKEGITFNREKNKLTQLPRKKRCRNTLKRFKIKF